jgi:hypothetical protein
MVAHSTVQPGWRWSIDMRPVVGGEWCQARHVGTILSGAFVFLFPDGARYELHAGDVYDMPPGHDGFTIGDEPCTVIEWAGVRAFGGFRAGLTGRHLVTLLLTDLVDSTSIARRGWVTSPGTRRWLRTVSKPTSKSHVLSSVKECSRVKKSRDRLRCCLVGLTGCDSS